MCPENLQLDVVYIAAGVHMVNESAVEVSFDSLLKLFFVSVEVLSWHRF